MITVTKEEHQVMVESSVATLMVKTKEALFEIRRGADLAKVSTAMCGALNNLVSLEHYETGAYEEEEYFNVVGPDTISGMYGNINTINTGLN